MSAIESILYLADFVLNLAGLLLWLNWRAIRFDPFTRPVPATFSGTVRRAEPARVKRWHFLAALGILLVVRAVLYWQTGPALNWVPTLDLVFVALSFRSHFLVSALLFSAVSFLRALIVFYFWLLFLAMVNRRAIEGDPFQKMIQLQLGRMARLPWFAQLGLPVLAVAVLWLPVHPLLVLAGVINPTHASHLAGQGLLVGAAVFFSLKYLVPVLLLTHSLATYVYLGGNPVWEFVSRTARNLVAPLNRLPLRLGKIDFAPFVGIALVLLLLHFLPDWIRERMMKRGWAIWPQ